MADFTLRASDGLRIPSGTRIGIVVSRWNDHITGLLLEGALESCRNHGLSDSDVDIFWCPGAYEIPLVVQKILHSDQYAGAIALGAVIRGSTPHFEYVAGAASTGISRVMLDTGKPISFGILTVDTLEQAMERAEPGALNKGGESALTLFEMIALLNQITH